MMLLMDNSNFVILDPLNLANNTTKNSYLTRDILMKFASAFASLKTAQAQVPFDFQKCHPECHPLRETPGLGRVGDEESTGVKGAAVGDTSISYEASLKNAFGRMPREWTQGAALTVSLPRHGSPSSHHSIRNDVASSQT